MAAFRLTLLRHGTTDANENGLFLGQTDAPLNARGRAEAALLARRLRDVRFDALVSSDLSRAAETADIVAASLALVPPKSRDPRLRELFLGEYEARVAKEVHANEPEFMARWMADPATTRFPGGETLDELACRAWDAIAALRAAHPAGHVGVVTHTFVILALCCRALDIELSRFRQFHVDRASLSVLEWRRFGPTLVHFNDTHHLSPP